MNGAWNINVSGRQYGPFTSERMRSFASEGRLAPHSLVALEGMTDWREARDEPEFADLFAPSGKDHVISIATQKPVAAAPAPANGYAAEQEKPSGTRAHFAVVVDIKSGSKGNIEETMSSFGPAYRLLPNVWIVSTNQSVNAVRNRLIQELGSADSLFVVDASRGKAAWFNFGPDADVRIRRVWQKAS